MLVHTHMYAWHQIELPKCPPPHLFSLAVSPILLYRLPLRSRAIYEAVRLSELQPTPNKFIVNSLKVGLQDHRVLLLLLPAPFG